MIQDKHLEKILRIDLKKVFLLLILRDYGPIGRYKLTDILNLPEGIVRGLLIRFQKKGYLLSNRRGSTLTRAGERELSKRLSILQIEALTTYDGEAFEVGPACVAVHMKSVGERIRHGIEERDSAVKGGATGAITLLFKQGSLIMPELSNLSREKPNEVRRISTIFNLKECDVILIVFAEDHWRALEGALFAASSLQELS